MKLKFLFIGLSLLSLVFAPASQAQFWGNSYTAVTYNMGLPTADTKDFTSPYSWRGMGLELRKFKQENLSYGLSLGWNIFHKETTETAVIAEGNGDATGRQNRTINLFPLMLGVQYYMGEKGQTRPYVGLYGPGFVVAQKLDIGVFSFQEDGWNWGLAPELGLLVPMKNRSANLLLNVRYNYAFEGYGRGPYSYLGFNLGFAWSSY